MSEATKVDEKAEKTAAKIVEDLFEHKEFSERLVGYLEGFEGGEVASLRAPWGRGKTDVLKRAYAIA